MKRSVLSISVSAALAVITTNSFAAPFSSFDPRTMAMGGAGVAVGNTATAPYFNPSLLSVTRDEDDFALELPILGMRAYDPEDFDDSVTDFQDAEYDTQLNNSINALNSATYPPTNLQEAQDYIAALNAVAGGTTALNNGLQTLDAKPLQLEIGAATVLGIPSKKYGVAFSAGMTGAFAGVFNYQDATLLSDLSADVTAFATYQDCLITAADPTTCTIPTLNYVDPISGDVINPTTGGAFDASTDILSEVNVLGLISQEISLSFSREFTIAEQTVAIGVTPKYVTTTVYDYVANANTADSEDADAEDFEKEYSDFNIDVGAAKDFGNGWRAGVVVKNLIKQEYETYRDQDGDGIQDPTGNHVTIEPQVRVGASLTSDWYMVAVDVDLTENDPIAFEDGSQYVSMGAELNMADWAQFRVGYRVDLSNSNRNIPSIGLGLSPGGVHFDLAVASSSDEVAASMQLGFRF